MRATTMHCINVDQPMSRHALIALAVQTLEAAESASNDDLATRVDIPQPDDRRGRELRERAARNYPDSPYLQAEWRRAVGVVRATKGGWRLDNPLNRRAA